MSTLGIALLTSGLTVLVTLIVTHLFNAVVAAPKKIRKQQEEKREEILNAIADVKLSLEGRLEESDKLQQIYQEEIRSDVELLKQGMQATLKNDLKVRYENWLKKGYAPMDARDDLEKMYQVYHGLGKNGVLTKLHDRFMDLPLEKPSKSIRIEEKEIA